MGYQRSRQTSTPAAVEITTPCHENPRGSTKRARRRGAIEDKENAAIPMATRGSQSRNPPNDGNNRLALTENGCSHSKSRKIKEKRDKGTSSIPRDNNRKRTCVESKNDVLEDVAHNSAQEKSEGLQGGNGVPAGGDTGFANAPTAHSSDEANGRLNAGLDGESAERLLKDDSDVGIRGEMSLPNALAIISNGVDNRKPTNDLLMEITGLEDLLEERSIAGPLSKTQELYSKLHLKYKRLKERRFGEVEECIREQNKNLTAYVEAQQKLLDFLRCENNFLKLHQDPENITMILNRSKFLEQENIECQNKLLAEHAENLTLIKEVNRLQLLLSGHVNVNKEHSAVQTEEVRYICHACGLNSRVNVVSEEVQYVGSVTSQSTADIVQVGKGKTTNFVGQYLRKDKQTGEATEMVGGRVNSLIQMLLQCMVGFTIKISDEGKSPQLLFLHQSSGYSFHLKCAHHENKLTEDGELIYQVVSLGTLHKVAPDWMKEEIIFSVAQVNVFMDRLLQVVKGHGHKFVMRR